jgi:catechol 2,3-dioxygenase-like lactoylglutathione lyase family enzyme
MTVFSRLDTVILRVRDLAAARQWYATTLGLHAVFVDADQGLAVLGLEGGSSLTLWALPDGEAPRPSSTFPIFAVADARAARERLCAHGVPAEPVVEAPGVRYVRFVDLDGNPLEACQVVEPAPESGQPWVERSSDG